MLRKLTKALFGKRSRAQDLTDHSPRFDDNPDDFRRQKQPRSSGQTGRARLEDLDLSDAEIVEREDHCITRKNISPNALKVLYRLNEAGYHAFLVGGGVRDLLLRNTPKDFDISTNATPEQIKQLFRNALIIGRRFRIVHLRFGREIIEVTTFRAHHQPANEFQNDTSQRQIKGLDSAHASSGLILRDNVYGAINEDALRRDFTVNALYYTVDGFRIIDFAGGLDDIDRRLLRIIGDPETRYREDPVRLLRAVRFASKLDFDIEQATRAPMDDLAYLLESISPARLFDESLKLLASGNAERTFAMLRQFKVGEFMFRSTMNCTRDQNHPWYHLVNLALRNTDARLADGRSVTPAFLYAALLWPPLQKELEKSAERTSLTAQQEAANRVIGNQLKVTSIPKRFTIAMREIWELQLRLSVRSRRGAENVFAHPRFRAAYDFLLLREEAGEQTDGLGQWWTEFQIGDKPQQERMLEALGKGAPRPRRRRRRSRKPAGSGEAGKSA